jgi:trk system potassium uptake protein TrkA
MKQFLIVGLGRFGSSVARTLTEKGHEVLGIDSNEDLVQEAATFTTQSVQMDATDEKSLRALGVKNFDVAVVAIGQDIQSSILCTLILKDIGIKYLVAKAQNHLHGKVLKKTGADRVVFLADGKIVDELREPTADSVLDRMKRLDAPQAVVNVEAGA